jgi:hypothetical protein
LLLPRNDNDTTADNHHRDKNSIRILLALLERWQGYLQYTDDPSRWLQFRNDFKLDDTHNDNNDDSSSSTSLKKDQRAVKKSMKHNRMVGNARLNLQDGEMCANCSILENQCRRRPQEEEDEEEENKSSSGLLSCARCMQIKYCSVKCQIEHWNKEHGHKNHCERRIKYHYSFAP